MRCALADAAVVGQHVVIGVIGVVVVSTVAVAVGAAGAEVVAHGGGEHSGDQRRLARTRIRRSRR